MHGLHVFEPWQNTTCSKKTKKRELEKIRQKARKRNATEEAAGAGQA